MSMLSRWQQWLRGPKERCLRTGTRARRGRQGFKPLVEALEGRVQPTVTITEFGAAIAANSFPEQIATGPDGNLWFTENSGNSIGRITPQGSVTEFSAGISVNSHLLGITAGPDGNLWFTENSGNRIGRITPQGTVTEFALPHVNNQPYGITAGPDGNLWFTEYFGNRIGRITPEGSVTEFSTGISANSFPVGITAGPDGSLWFTESHGNGIGRITPQGNITEFSTGVSANSEPFGITAGSDGNLWFTEKYGNIGRITPQGSITEFSTGIAVNSHPVGITGGPDGNLWFTESFANRLGMITPQGSISEFSTGISANSQPEGITLGPNGNLWFAENSGDRIASSVISGSPFPANLTISMSQPGNFRQGDASDDYTLTVSNLAGYGPTSGIVSVTDVLPAGLTYVGPASSNGWTIAAAGQQVTATRADALAPDSSYPDLILAVTVANDAPRSLTNSAAVAGGGDVTPANNSSCDATTITPAVSAIITEFSTGILADSSFQSIASGPDGNLWLTDVESNRIGRITPQGTVTEFSAGISANSRPSSITTGPDNNLWFTEANGNRIGRITPQGTVTEFSTGISAGSGIGTITAGSDGNLWFTELAGNRIGRITPQGSVTEFSSGISANSFPAGITSGPDGNLWFTEANGNRIGRITLQGSVSEFNTGNTIGPATITSGPDGNLWFTEIFGTAIGRITPQGSVTEFSTGLSSSSLVGDITSGPDGNLWFTEGYSLSRITPQGSVTEFSKGISAYHSPGGITTGPDGNLWFTEVTSIGRAVISATRPNADLTVTMSHLGDFHQGDVDNYAITVSNLADAVPTFGTVSVTDVLPVGLSYAGPTASNGWAITTAGQQVTASRTDVLAPGDSYPVLSLAVNVANNSPLTATNSVTVSGGGDVTPDNDGSSDPTAIVPAAAWGTTEFSTGLPAFSNLNDITTGPDGNLWFTEYNCIGRITPQGVLTEFSTGIPYDPRDITTGPDGNLWFTDYAGDSISRITPQGNVTDFTTGIAQFSHPAGITVGPDGNLWFTEATAGTIGRITPQGSVTIFNVGATDITAGPDGNLWFSQGNSVGRITPQGIVTVFSTGITAGADIRGITTGPDGNLWFTEATGNRIGRITPQGSVTEFSAGISAGSSPTDITVGPDGNLWFTEWRGDLIGRITPQGSVTEFSTGDTPGSGASGITVGPDGNLWFTEHNANQVARFIFAGRQPAADLNVTTSHTGNFHQGDASDSYSITVSDLVGSAPTSSTVTVTDLLPAGLTYVGPASSNGWAIVAAGQQVTATRADVLAAGDSYPVLTLAVRVASNAPASVINNATVSGSGDLTLANDSSGDPTTINPAISVTATLPSGSVGIAYSQAVTFAGGTNLQQPAFTFDPGTTGLSPAAVALGNTPFTVTIQGTASHTGTATLKVLAKDDVSSLSHTFTIVFTVPMPTLNGPISPVTTTATPAIAWSDTAAARYDLWVDDTTAKISQFLRKPNLTTPAFTPPAPLTSGHTYTAWVEGFTALGEASGWSPAYVFTVSLPAAPAIPVLTAPLGTSMNTAPTFTWTDAGAARYDLWVNDVTAKQSQVMRQQTLTVPSFTPANPLTGGHQYIAWVEAFDSLGQTAGWSQALTFTVGQATPAVPSLSGPSNPAPATPTFNWTSTGADHYDLWVDDATAHVSQVIRRQNLVSTSFTATTPLLGGHQYTAWVNALNSLGQSGGWSQPLTFVVVGPPSAPVLTGPAGNTSTAAPTITWNPPASGAPVGYDLWLSDATAGGALVSRQQNLPTAPTTFTTVPLNAGDQYQAWVRAFDAQGQFSPWSAAETFTIGTPPGIPSWTAPAPGATIAGTPTLAWTTTAAATSYELWVSDRATPNVAFIDQTGLSAPSLSTFTPAPTAGHQYTAWVRALNNLNQKGPWSAPLTFTMVLAAPTLTGPTSPASTTPNITWTESTPGAVRYDLWVDDITSKTTQAIRQKNLTGLSFTTASLAHGHTYSVWVQAFDAFGQASLWQATPLVFTVA